MLLALVSTMVSMTSFPLLIQDRDHNRFLVYVHADILDVATHFRCLLGGKIIRANGYLSPQGQSAILSPDLPMSFCGSFAPHSPAQLLSSAAVAERSPCTA